MKKKLLFFLLGFLFTIGGFAQHKLNVNAELLAENHSMKIRSELVLDTLFTADYLYLYDWNHAYSSTSTPLGQRFSDEFVRSFYYAEDKDRSFTTLHSLRANGQEIPYTRMSNQADIIQVDLRALKGQKLTLELDYTLKFPHARFGRYGYADSNLYYLNHFLVRPAKTIDNQPVLYSNENLDDARYAPIDLTFKLQLPDGLTASSNLANQQENAQQIQVQGENIYGDFSMEILPQSQSTWRDFNLGSTRIRTNFHSKDMPDWQQHFSLTQLMQFTETFLGIHPQEFVWVSSYEYSRNPFYGLNQLPQFLRPFEQNFLYEIQFLKAYLRAYIRTAFDVDLRTENAWAEGLQIYILRAYVERFYPDAKLVGRLNNWWILQGFYFTHLDFNQQYTYYSLLMARKNLDQPLGTSKADLIKFNQQIANPYRAGLYLRNLEAYVGKAQFLPVLRNAVTDSKKGNFQRDRMQFQLETVAQKDLNWYFDSAYNSRKTIDYRILKTKTRGDSTYVSLRNIGGIQAPITLSAIENGKIVKRQWVEGFSGDTTLVYGASDRTTWALNLEDISPEFNQRDNWYRSGKLFNRPINLTFMKDVEFPHVQQLLWVPNFEYNLYDGFSPGLRLHNRTVLDKKFTFDIIPTYSIKTGQPIGSGSLIYNHYRRESNWYYTRFSVSGNYFHYAPEATYTRWNPMIQWRYRPSDLRKNTNHLVTLRYVMVDRETSPLALDDYKDPNYNVFNLRWSYGHNEIQKNIGLTVDNQWSPQFIKQQITAQYSSFFAPNRQWSLRVFAGAFWKNKTDSDFFSLGVDRPSDYLFDHNYYGRSEDSGLFSQQYIKSEGALKTLRADGFANQWLTSANASFTIWNWIEGFGDIAWYADKGQSTQLVYDAGIRLNLVPDYFELYFPVYSENGWVGQAGDYSKQIRFVLTIDPKTLINLATRRWW